MSHPRSILSREQFSKWVQDVLNRLYDSPYLQTHPLGEMLYRDGARTLQYSQQVRKVLMDAIEELRPPANVPAQSPDWRAYRILEMRYIGGFPPLEVMHQLGLARSQYFREQARALEGLTNMLWERWQPSLLQESAPAMEANLVERTELAQTEIDRLNAHSNWEQLDAHQLLDDLKPVLTRLAQARGFAVEFETPAQPIMINANRIILRQVLLTAFSLALDLSEGRSIGIHSQCTEDATEICLLVETARHASAMTALAERLEVCQKLMSSMDGELYPRQYEPQGLELRLAWPTLSPKVVLVIDDNQGIAELFRRYLAVQNWHVIGAAGAAEARRVVAHVRPDMIILDILMPEEDGWELLMSLKQDEYMRSIPIIICSVLDDPQLVLTLGADAYLPKPVSQQALLEMLAALAGK